MGGQPKSTSHFHVQGKETGDAKGIDVASPHADKFTGAVLPTSNQEQRKTVSRHSHCPASRGSDLHSGCQKYSSGGWAGAGDISPNSVIYVSLDRDRWANLLFPARTATPQSLRCHQPCGDDSRERSPCVFHEERVCWAGFFKPHHKCIFISLKEEIVFKDFSTLFMSQWKPLITNGSYLFTKASL